MAFLLAVLTGTSISICFKLFQRWRLDMFNVIVINYTFCFLLGLLFEGNKEALFSQDFLHESWLIYDAILGLLLIIGFNLTAYAISRFGITRSVLMQKMSIILTVGFILFFYRESLNLPELIGIIMALTAIAAITSDNNKQVNNKSGAMFLILGGLLVVSASIEILLYYVERENIIGIHLQLFTTLGFGSAGLIGWIILILSLIFKKKVLQWKEIRAGLLLSIPNYFSIFLLLIMLDNDWKGSILYPLLNVCVLLFSTLAALAIFKESLSTVNRIGVGIAAAAILLIAAGQNLTW